MIDRILKQFWFPIVVQAAMLAIFILIIMCGWNIYTPDTNTSLYLRYTNLANLLVWNYWWPAVIFIAILAGRLWCTVCPMEFIQNALSRIGLKRKPPRWLRSGWVITILFGVILLIGMHTYSIRMVPHQMSLYMLSLVLLTAVIALIFEKRTFCSYVCPVGNLLGLCSVTACAEMRVKDKAVCNSCREKPCISVNRQNAWHGRACQSNLYPGALADNRDCVLCTQCMKACRNDNVTFRLRKPMEDLYKGFSLKSAEAAFMILILGHAFLGIVGEWNASSAWIHTPFNTLNQVLGIHTPYDGTVNGIWFLILIPSVLLLGGSALTSWFDEKIISLERFGTVLVAFVPLMVSTLLAKSIFTPLSRLQNIPTALADPYGWDAAHAMVIGLLHVGGTWQLNLNDAARYVSAIIMLAGFVVTHILLLRIPKKNKLAALPLIFVSLLYVGITVSVMTGSALEPNDLFVEPINPCGATPVTIPTGK